LTIKAREQAREAAEAALVKKDGAKQKEFGDWDKV